MKYLCPRYLCCSNVISWQRYAFLSSLQIGSSTFRGSTVPTGPRVSDWCFVGSLDSDPPVVSDHRNEQLFQLLIETVYQYLFIDQMMTRTKDAPGVDISYTVSTRDCRENNEDEVSCDITWLMFSRTDRYKYGLSLLYSTIPPSFRMRDWTFETDRHQQQLSKLTAKWLVYWLIESETSILNLHHHFSYHKPEYS